MEQVSGQLQQQERPPTPLRCPRCGSLYTKFRYFNNRSLAQPRHLCKTCKREWTVGGNLRDIPFGGRTCGKQTNASSSGCSNPNSQTPQPPLTIAEEHLQNAATLLPIAAAVPRTFGTTMFQPATNLPTASPRWAHISTMRSPLFSIQSLIQPEVVQPEVINQHSDHGNQFGSANRNMGLLEGWNIQTMPSQQALPQQFPSQNDSYQTHCQANNAPPGYLYNNTLAQPTCPVSSLAQQNPNYFSFSTSDASLRNNFVINSADAETDTSSVNVDEWLNFSDYSP